MLLWLIIACEIGFWVILFFGLFIRYILKAETLGKYCLYLIPVLDLTLLIATAMDLRSGAIAEFAHGLAAVYLGFTLIFGKQVISWADENIAYRFSAGSKPAGPPESGWAYTKYEWVSWFRGLLACSIAGALLQVAIIYVGNAERTKVLSDWFYVLGSLLFFWLIFYPLWYTFFPKKSKT